MSQYFKIITHKIKLHQNQVYRNVCDDDDDFVTFSCKELCCAKGLQDTTNPYKLDAYKCSAHIFK